LENSPDIDVRKKALDIAMDMVSSKNVEEVVMLLKKELAKTVDQDYEKVSFIVIHRPGSVSDGSRIMSTDNFSSTPSILAPSGSRRLLQALLDC
jgi:hypothetical protein